MSTEANKAIVRRYMEEGLNEGDMGVLEECVAPEFSFNGRPLNVRQLAELHEARRQRFSDVLLSIEDQVAEGDVVVTRVTVTGKHTGEVMGIPPTGRLVSYPAIAIDRIVDGRVVDAWHFTDTWEMLRQIGASLRSFDEKNEAV